MTADEFKTACPTFEDVAADVIDRHLATAALFPTMSSSKWGARLALATTYLTAHLISVEDKHRQLGVTAKAGDVVSASTAEGSRSRSDAAVQMQIKNPLLRTEWGQMFVDLQQQVLGTPGVISSTGRGYTSRGLPTGCGGRPPFVTD